MMEFDADLLDMFDLDEFGSAIHLPNGSTIQGNFEMNPLVINEGESSISTNTQLLLVRTSDVVGLAQEDEVVIDNVSYEVSDIRPDGTGATEITLRKLI